MADPTSRMATVDPEDRRKHLEFIQAVVTRMSAASSSAKGWILPVVTVTYGYSITQRSGKIALLGIIATLLFALLDANYLRQEKSYRRLYDTVARELREVPLFSLDPSDADDPIPRSAGRKERLVRLCKRWLPGPGIWLSWSIAPFYGALVFVGLAIYLRA